MDTLVADVLMPLALDTAYSYAVPAHLDLDEGDVVCVPLGTRETVGVVWSLRQGAGLQPQVRAPQDRRAADVGADAAAGRVDRRGTRSRRRARCSPWR